MSFPIEKYKYIEHTTKDGQKQIIAISTYAGRTVKGVATCALGDEYNEADGKILAAARCQQKVAKKRLKQAQRKQAEAFGNFTEALHYLDKMNAYLADAKDEVVDANEHLDKILTIIG